MTLKVKKVRTGMIAIKYCLIHFIYRKFMRDTLFDFIFDELTYAINTTPDERTKSRLEWLRTLVRLERIDIKDPRWNADYEYKGGDEY